LSIKPGDLLVGLGDGEVGGKIFLVLEIPPFPRWGRSVSLLRDGKVIRENLSWLEIKTQPLESLIEAR
jgi:hypothetical protein